METVFVEGDDVIRRNLFLNFCSLKQKRVDSLMWSAEERQTEGGRLLLWEFWGNSENAVSSGGATLNKPSTIRGALPSVCGINPLLSGSTSPCCARFATSAKSRAAVTSEETKEPQEREGRHAENEGRNGTGRFICRSADLNRSHNQRNQVNNRTLLRLFWHMWKLKNRTTATGQDQKVFSPDLTEKKGITNSPKQWQISPPARWGQAWAPSGAWSDASSRTGRPRFLCFPSSSWRKKKTSQSSNFLFPPAKLENQNSQIIQTVWLTHESRGSPVRVLTEPKCGVRVPKCHLHLITRSGLQFYCILPKTFKRNNKSASFSSPSECHLSFPENPLQPISRSDRQLLTTLTPSVAKLSGLPDVSIHYRCVILIKAFRRFPYWWAGFKA